MIKKICGLLFLLALSGTSYAIDTTQLDVTIDQVAQQLMPTIVRSSQPVQNALLQKLGAYHGRFEDHSEREYIVERLAILIQDKLDRAVIRFGCVDTAPLCQERGQPHCNMIQCVDDDHNYYHFVQWADTSTIISDPVYATHRNLAGQILHGYESEKVVIEKNMIGPMQDAYTQLVWFVTHVPMLSEVLGDRELVFILKDVYRPYQGSVHLFESAMAQDIHPAYITYGGDHTRGAAIDLTIGVKDVDGTVTELWMGSTFDEFHTHRTVGTGVETTGVSHHVQGSGWQRTRSDDDVLLSYRESGFADLGDPMMWRAILRESMARAGFKPYDKERRHYALIDIRHSHPRYHFPVY